MLRTTAPPATANPRQPYPGKPLERHPKTLHRHVLNTFHAITQTSVLKTVLEALNSSSLWWCLTV